MNLLNKLTIKNLKLNKKRTIVTIIGIILSVALLTAVATMFFSARQSLILFEATKKGDYHFSFADVPKDDLKYFEENRHLESLNYVVKVGYALLKESKNQSKPYAYIEKFDENALHNLSINLVEGRLPTTESEILIPTHLKTNGRIEYKIGQTITLDVGSRMYDDGKVGQSTPFIDDEENPEKIVDTISKNYKIVGIIERPDTSIEPYTAPGYTFITYLNKEDIQDSVDIYTRFTKKALQNRFEVLSSLTGVAQKYYEVYYRENVVFDEKFEKELREASDAIANEKYHTDLNSYLISLETNLFGDSSMNALATAATVVCVIIIFTSVFCIKNSFDISITEKNRQYGMLSSIGATHKQIKKNVYFEAFILGLIGIPLGVLLGLLASFILIIVCNILLKDIVNFSLVLKISYIAILLSIFLGIITIFLSAWRSAHRASKINPIAAIRSNDDIKIKAKKLKSPRYIKKIFGIGGDVAYKNIKRNKKKYRTTVLSIIICSSVFITLYYFINIAFFTIKQEYSTTDYNISLSYDFNSKELVTKAHEVLNMDNIKDYSIYKRSDITIINPQFSKEFREIYPDHLEEQTYEDDDGNMHTYQPQENLFIVSVGDHAYQKYVKELGLKLEEVKDKGIIINYIREYKASVDSRESKEVIIPRYSYKVGDNLEYYYQPRITNATKIESTIEIAALTRKVPFGMKEVSTNMATLIVSDELYSKIVLEPLDGKYDNQSEIIYIDANNPDQLQDDIDKLLDNYDYYLVNTAESVKMMRSLYLLIAIFLYGFIIVIALIGITNIFNTITTNMELRKREFATLRSIGMTNKEFNRMISLESFLYGMKSLIIGIPIGCLLSYLLYRILVNGDTSIPYQFPIGAIVITIIVVFLLLLCIMKYSINKINKQNTIETIRNENI